MNSLSEILEYIYEVSDCYSPMVYKNTTPIDLLSSSFTARKYLTILKTNNVFDIPVFTFKNSPSFIDSLYDADVFVAPIERSCKIYTTTSFSSNVKKGLVTEYDNTVIEVKDKENNLYYVGRGAVFDHKMTPLMICSFRIALLTSLQETPLCFLSPVLHVKASCYLSKKNAMERFIVNKFIPEALAYSSRYLRPSTCGIACSDDRKRVIVEIKDEIGIMESPEQLSVAPNTADFKKELCKVAIDHIDDAL